MDSITDFMKWAKCNSKSSSAFSGYHKTKISHLLVTFVVCFVFLGCPDISSIMKGMVVHESHYHKL